MKKLLPIILITFITSAGYGQADSVCNPSFEDMLTNWTTFANAGAVATFSSDSTDAQDGTKTMKVQVDTLPGTVVASSCTGDLDSNFTYRISFWAKSDTGSLDLKASTAKATSNFADFGVANVTVTNTWQKFSFNASNATSLTGDVKIMKFRFNSEGTYYIDGIQIEKLVAFPEICDGDFEVGLGNFAKTVSAPSSQIIEETTDVHSGTKSARMEAPDLSSGSVILSSCKSDLEAGKKYKIKFYAKAVSGTMDVEASSALASPPYSVYGSSNITLNTSWMPYEYTCSLDSTIKGDIRIFKVKAVSEGTCLFDSVTIEEVPPQAEICDNNFETDLSNWTTSITNGAVAQITVNTDEFHVGSQSAKIEVVTAGSVQSAVQLSSCKSDIFKDQEYTVYFWAKTATGNVDIIARTSLTEAPFTDFGSGNFTITDSWKPYCYSFTSDTSLTGLVRVLKLQFPNTGTVFIDEATVVNGSFDCATIDTVKTDSVGGIAEGDFSDLKVYPNPTSDVVNFSVDNDRIESIEVRNLIGATVISSTDLYSEKATLSTKTLPIGNYIVFVNTQKGTMVRKLKVIH